MPDSHNLNLFMLLVDGMEYSVFENKEEGRALAPTISCLIDNGFVRRIVSNGMMTQAAMPAIFSQTYPLDYDGYNDGIRYRPGSFVEELKRHGYKTNYVCSHDSCGARNGYGRGFDQIQEIYNYHFILESYKSRYLTHYLDLQKSGEMSESELLNRFQREFRERMEYAYAAAYRVHIPSAPHVLQCPPDRLRKAYKEELVILNQNPEVVLEKYLSLPFELYLKMLGHLPETLDQQKVRRRVERCQRWQNIKNNINKYFGVIARGGLTLLPVYISPIASEGFGVTRRFIDKQSGHWFSLLHVMDAHDGPKTCRHLNFLCKLRFVPRLLKIRKKFPTHRNFWRDLSLIYLDKEFDKFLQHLKQKGEFDKTLFVVCSDHGMGWDVGRGKADMKNLGFRTHYEHTQTPLIISPADNNIHPVGIHDGMSIPSTILKKLGIKNPQASKGIPVDEPGHPAAIIECAGRGNCDVQRRDIYFTIRSKSHRMMVRLEKNKLIVERLFNLQVDPKEYSNIIHDDDNDVVINQHLSYLEEQRGDLLAKRGATIKNWEKLPRVST